MYEFFIAFKYLLPKRKHLARSLISILSIFVISLVVWLAVIFLSVTTGIEKNWLKKLTSLNAPIRITPTNEYFSSYYYQIDNISSLSTFSTKSIKEKYLATFSDPYMNDVDMEIPSFMPKADRYKNGNFIDPVKEAYKIFQTNNLIQNYQDYEISGALMRLMLLRQNANDDLLSFNRESISFLTQMYYLLSICENNPNLKSLVLKPSINDLNNILFHIKSPKKDAVEDMPTTKSENTTFLENFLENIEIKKVQTQIDFLINLSLFSKDKAYFAKPIFNNGKIKYLLLTNKKDSSTGEIQFIENDFFFSFKDKTYVLKENHKIYLENTLTFNVVNHFKNFEKLEQNFIDIESDNLEIPLSGRINFEKLKIADANIFTEFSKKPKTIPLWAYFIDGKINLPENDFYGTGILLPKTAKDNNVFLTDSGYLSYAVSSATSTTEQRLPMYVAGFYDPGVLPIGSKCLIVPQKLTSIINLASATFSPDGSPNNGFFVWTKDLNNIDLVKENLSKNFEKKQISKFWNIETFKDFEFSKDLMQQFHSDKIIFMLIAIIIIIVACSNIISLLILLVNDKTKEIATLQAMGATKKSIATIFGICGIFMGCIGSLIGTAFAIITLKNLNVLVSLLSKIQGHDAFNVAFFGKNLPNDISVEAIIFVLILTPLISLVAGLIPAIKASLLKPAEILRQQ